MRYSAIIIPHVGRNTYSAAIEYGGRVQRLYRHYKSYADAKAACEHTIAVKRRNNIRRGFERLVDAVAPEIAAVPVLDPIALRNAEDDAGAAMAGDRFE